jgi:CRISPR-associated endonuclease/helicase Cas3
MKCLPQIAEVPPPTDLEIIQRYQFQKLASEQDAFAHAKSAVENKHRVLWICNTVKRAQRVLKQLADQGIAARTYHSRFKYKDRVRQHRKVIRWFAREKRRTGIVAVTTQVAEMSLDLDADLLISEIAPTPSLIQRLGRLNRRVTPENPGDPRTALFFMPKKPAPYEAADLRHAEKWIDELIAIGRPLSQTDLSERFNALSSFEELRLDTRTAWLDSGWFATPEPVRDSGYSVSVILAEDEKPCRESNAEIIKRAIPMNYAKKMSCWPEFKGHFIAPPGAISYRAKAGAVLS